VPPSHGGNSVNPKSQAIINCCFHKVFTVYINFFRAISLAFAKEHKPVVKVFNILVARFH